MTDKDHAAWRALWLILSAIVLSLMPYTLIAVLVAPEGAAGSMGQTLTIPFAVVAAGLLIGATFARRIVMQRAVHVSSEDAVMGVYRVASLITWVMIEGIALLGLIIVYLGGGLMTFFTFAGLALAGLLYFRPSRSEFSKLMDARRRVQNAPDV